MYHNISVDYRDELLLGRMDAKLIIQVIINLVDNAVKYTPAGSDIRITAQRSDGFISVSVADNGDGIPDALKERVFEMFYTGDNKIADSRRSLGLELYLCRFMRRKPERASPGSPQYIQTHIGVGYRMMKLE
ncbi:MAG: hypothetical protein IJM24_10535 [Clostridia bacterium]|nr:hypothetical protein [Clostridia bacterium]